MLTLSILVYKLGLLPFVASLTLLSYLSMKQFKLNILSNIIFPKFQNSTAKLQQRGQQQLQAASQRLLLLLLSLRTSLRADLLSDALLMCSWQESPLLPVHEEARTQEPGRSLEGGRDGLGLYLLLPLSHDAVVKV